ncbi:IPTL-CTERM sorting domain-containing protein [Comamonas serinivorans]|nr:IPTL-CTERM sorting domain-containing protein [Comamonas serinivorans]
MRDSFVCLQWLAVGCLATAWSAGAAAQQAPVLDLNSADVVYPLIENGDFTNTSTWSATGKWTYGGAATTTPTYVLPTPDNPGPHGLNAPHVDGWQSGPSVLGGVRVQVDILWTDGAGPSSFQNVLRINVGGTTYATIASSNGVGTTATVTYAPGIVGNLTTLTAGTTSTLVLELPSTISSNANLEFSYTAPESASSDIFRLDNVSAQAFRDTSPGRDLTERYDQGSVPIGLLGPEASVRDPDGTTLQSATVVFTNPQAGDVLLLNGTPMMTGSSGMANGIAYSVSAGPTVSFTGAGSHAAYIGALKGFTFQATAASPSPVPRIISFVVNDGVNPSNVARSVITVNASPVATDNVKAILSDHSSLVTGNLLTDDDGFGVDSDPNGDAFTFTTVNGTAVLPGTALTGSYGAWVFNPDGSYTYQLDTANPAVMGLAQGQVLEDTVTYRISERGASVKNVSFETDFTPSPTDGWVAIGARFGDENTTDFNQRFIASPDGGRFVMIQGNGYDPLGSSGVIQQNVSGLIIGATYQLRFYQTIANQGEYPNRSGFVRTTFGHDVVDSPTLTPPAAGTAAPWQLVTHTFTATSTTQLLELRGVPVGTQGWSQLVVDGVTLDLINGTPLFGEATAKITISPVPLVNAPPVSQNGAASTPNNQPLTSTLPAATDPDGDPITYAQGATQPAHGAVVVNADGSYTYTPTSGYEGPDSFSFIVSDGRGGTSEYTVSITVLPAVLPVIAPVPTLSTWMLLCLSSLLGLWGMRRTRQG